MRDNIELGAVVRRLDESVVRRLDSFRWWSSDNILSRLNLDADWLDSLVPTLLILNAVTILVALIVVVWQVCVCGIGLMKRCRAPQQHDDQQKLLNADQRSNSSSVPPQERERWSVA